MKKIIFVFAILGLACAMRADDLANGTPVKKFRLPTFNDQGFRTSLLVGDQAIIVSQSQIDIQEMHFTIFTGDETNAVDTTLLSPVATVHILDHEHTLVDGKTTVRIIRADLDASGKDWSFAYPEKKLIMRQDVHVTIRAPMTDILK